MRVLDLPCESLRVRLIENQNAPEPEETQETQNQNTEAQNLIPDPVTDINNSELIFVLSLFLTTTRLSLIATSVKYHQLSHSQSQL